MTGQPQPAEPAPAAETDPIATALAGAGVRCALVIDDAFDIPTRSTFGASSLDDFWAAVQATPLAKMELERLKPEATDVHALDDECIGLMWKERATLANLAPIAVEHLFRDKLGELTRLTRLCDGLRSLIPEVIELDSQATLPTTDAQIVFLDYILGEGATGIERARVVAETLRARADRPFVVLMSSKPEQAGPNKDLFRRATGLIAGLFGFVPKDDLFASERLPMLLATWAMDMPTRHDLQKFVDALEKASSRASEKFVKNLHDLSFEDYVNIQWLSLQKEGHPLGDYLLWLYRSHLAYLLHSDVDVVEEQSRLDKVSYKSFRLGQYAPSEMLATLYRSATTEPGIQPLATHPRAAVDSTTPFLSFGDLFVAGNGVRLVLNAACDLAYAPPLPSRKFPADTSVLLLHGVLEPSSPSSRVLADEQLATDMFLLNGRITRIVWMLKQVDSVKYSDVWTWLNDREFRRETRLAAPVALELQQAFVSGLGRVGNPIRPPQFWSVRVDAYCEGEDGNFWKFLDPIEAGALVLRGGIEGEDEFCLTHECAARISESLAPPLAVLERQRVALEEEAKNGQGDAKARAKQKLAGLITKIGKMTSLKSARTWLPMFGAHLVPEKGGKKDLVPGLFTVHRDKSLDGAYKQKEPIVLHITVEVRAGPETPVHPPETEIVRDDASHS